MPRFSSARVLVLAGMTLAIAALTMRDTQAHKNVTSPYVYNKDVFPLLRDKCGRCHVENGVAPMGLLAYNDGPNSATPWAEGIRELLISEQMPPWYVDPVGPAVKGGYGLSPKESDTLITWATGGTPQGDPDRKTPKITLQSGWTGGAPDLKIPMAADYTMPEATNDETKEFVLATGLTETRWVKGVDLVPGAATIVRNAVISTESGSVLTVWVPGDELITAPSGAAFKLEAGSKLRLQIHYKKQWSMEGKAVTDRSTVGLYFTDPPASGREIQSVAIDAPVGQAGETSAFGGALPANARIVAVRPSLDQVYGSVTVQAVTPNGAKVPLLKLRNPRPEWRRRYWLAEPTELPAGSKIEVAVTPPGSYIDLTGARLMKSYPLQVVLDVVPQG
jgi:hypothetical protein